MRPALASALCLAGCAHGWMQTATLGGTFDDHGHAALVATVEVSAIVHERFAPPRPAEPVAIPDRAPPRYMGLAASAGGAAVLGRTLGQSGFAAAGVSYLPYLFANGGMVGIGAVAELGIGSEAGAGVAPRLWFAIPASRAAGGTLDVGLMLRCQMLLDSGNGCGPSVVLSRVTL